MAKRHCEFYEALLTQETSFQGRWILPGFCLKAARLWVFGQELMVYCWKSNRPFGVENSYVSRCQSGRGPHALQDASRWREPASFAEALLSASELWRLSPTSKCDQTVGNDQTAAATASPISRVPILRAPDSFGLKMSPVRLPAPMAFVTAVSMASAAAFSPKL